MFSQFSASFESFQLFVCVWNLKTGEIYLLYNFLRFYSLATCAAFHSFDVENRFEFEICQFVSGLIIFNKNQTKDKFRLAVTLNFRFNKRAIVISLC